MEFDLPNDILIDWTQVEPQVSAGTTGNVTSRAAEIGKLRIRLLDFSGQYLADHWCEKGHIISVQRGTLIIEYNDGSKLELTEGMTLVLGDNISSHRARTYAKAQVLIVD